MLYFLTCYAIVLIFTIYLQAYQHKGVEGMLNDNKITNLQLLYQKNKQTIIIFESKFNCL